MKIGLNLLYLLPGVVGGTQTYAESLIKALAELDKEDEFTVFTSEEGRSLELPDPPNFRRVVCPVAAVRREARYAYEQLVFPWQIQAHRVDLLHSLGYVGPLFPPCPHVVSIHDLIYRGHQVMMTGSKQKALEFFVKQVARRSDCIITMSESSKQEILEDIPIPSHKIVVIHEAGRPAAAPASSRDVSSVLARYGITLPYMIAFSSPNPVKNIPRLIEAFAGACGDLPHQLVLVGHLPDKTNFTLQAARVGAAGRVISTGYVPDADIAPLIQGAALFAFPSLYEGFGLPALDAQQAGVPVVTSRAASLPEVVGEGAVLFDPLSVEQMSAAIRDCLLDQTLRERLIALGHANTRRFSWEQTAQQTLAVYRQIQKE